MKQLKLRERKGFATFRMRMLYRLIYPFFHCKCVPPQDITDSDDPVVFVANHYNVFGPVSFMASMPIDSSAWVNEELITPESTESAMINGVSKILPFLKKTQVRRICKKLSSTVYRVIMRFGPIPVSQDEPAKLAGTLRKSIETLASGQNLTIFPETGIPEYSLTSVSPFYSGFAVLGRQYWRKTGKTLRFCPTYIDKQHHEISFGQPVSWNPESPDIAEECSRISNQLSESIRAMAASFHGIEKQQRMPVRKTLLRLCNVLRLLLLIPLIIVYYGGHTFPALILYCVSQGIRIVVNLIRGTLPATNHGSFILSHGITILTDISMMFRLAGTDRHLYPTTALLVTDLLLFIGINLHTYFKANRCAGTNYFDTLSSNLNCLFIIVHLTQIPLKPFAEMVCRMVLAGFLFCATVYNLIFNHLVLQKETQD